MNSNNVSWTLISVFLRLIGNLGDDSGIGYTLLGAMSKQKYHLLQICQICDMVGLENMIKKIN